MNPAHWFHCNNSSLVCMRKYGHLYQPLFLPFIYGRLCKWEYGGDQMAVCGQHKKVGWKVRPHTEAVLEATRTLV